MAQIALIAPATVIPITGRGKQQQKLSYARKKVGLASLVRSWRIQRVPTFAFASSNNNDSGDDRRTSVVVKVSDGGAISLPQGPPILHTSDKTMNEFNG
ncbi:hypothetical protein AAZX31_18G031000 [Glycine max]